MPGGEQRQFDGKFNDDYSIEVLVYRKSQIYIVFIAELLTLYTRFKADVLPFSYIDEISNFT